MSNIKKIVDNSEKDPVFQLTVTMKDSSRTHRCIGWGFDEDNPYIFGITVNEHKHVLYNMDNIVEIESVRIFEDE